MFVAGRRLDGLIVDAGIGHADAELDEGGNRPPLEVEHRRGLPQHVGLGEVSAARIGDGRHAHAPLSFGNRGQSLQPAHPGLAEALGVGHDVGLRHRHQILGAEEFADLDLMLQGLLRQEAGLARENILFFVVQFHSHHSSFTPASCTALPHLASSLC